MENFILGLITGLVAIYLIEWISSSTSWTVRNSVYKQEIIDLIRRRGEVEGYDVIEYYKDSEYRELSEWHAQRLLRQLTRAGVLSTGRHWARSRLSDTYSYIEQRPTVASPPRLTVVS